jgi:hypothetical protein
MAFVPEGQADSFVPEGQADSSQARSAWVVMQRGPVPEGRSKSSAWIHQTFRQLDNFSWQQGYGAFSVSVSQLPETIHDIQNQVEHHRTRTFQEEDLVHQVSDWRSGVAIKMGRRQGGPSRTGGRRSISGSIRD